jgi:hypothetical protein
MPGFATLQNYYKFRFIGCKGHGIATRRRRAIHVVLIGVLADIFKARRGRERHLIGFVKR